MPDPVSWLVIERGWAVVGSDGEELGTVDRTVGDSNADIFSALVVSPGFLRSSRYVPAERVGSITEGRVEVDVTREQFERLADYEEPPPHADVRHDTTDLRPG